MMRRLAVLALAALPVATSVKVGKAEPSAEDKLEALQPVLEKLRGLDSKTFGMISSMLSQAGAGTPPRSFLQFLRDEPDDDAERKLEALQPVLEKLRGLDGKTFGMLSSMLSQASTVKQGHSFLQYQGEPEASSKLEALQPVLEKLRGLDPKTFGMLSSMLSQAGTKEGTSLLQVLSGDDPAASSKLEALQPVLEKLRNLDPKSFGMLSSMLSHAGDHSFLQVEEPDADAKLEALQPVLEKLRGLDPKTFGMLSGMLSQAQTSQGRSFLQLMHGDAPDAEAKLEALQPVLEKLKGLDPKTFSMLSGMIAQAQSK